MSSQEDELGTLMELGLTTLQAKVYLALVRLGGCKAGAAAEQSKVTRPDIYRVIRELNELGMVEKTIARPTEFRATPIEQGIPILFERKIRKMSELHSKTEKLIKKFTETKPTTITRPEGFKFVEIPERGSLLAEILEKRKATNWQTLDIVSSWKRTIRFIVVCRKEIEETLNRGVRIRIIVDKPQQTTKSSLRNLNALRKNRLFEIRYLPTLPPALINIQDNEEAHLALKPSPFGIASFGPFLFSNHTGFVGLARIYFDSLWDKALEKGNVENAARQTHGNRKTLPRTQKQKMMTASA